MRFFHNYTFVILFIFNQYNILGQTVTLIQGKVTKFKSKEIKLSRFDFVTQKDSIYSNALIESDSTFTIKLNLNTPSPFRLVNSIVWITPGDTINLLIDGISSVLDVQGNNNGNYLIFNKLRLSINSVLINEYNKDNYDNYIKDLTNEFDRKFKAFSLFKKSAKTSDAFESFAIKELEFEYLRRCMILCYMTTIDNCDKLFHKYHVLDRIDCNDENFSTISYPIFLSYYSFYLAEKKIAKDADDETKLKQSFDIIENKFNNRSQEALKIILLRQYALKDISKYETLINTLISKSLNKTTNIQYTQELMYIHDLINICDRPFPKEVLNSKLFDTDSTKITLLDILLKNQNKIVIIDFWATWCAPCIKEIPYIKKLYDDLDTNKISLIFLSRDRKFSDWKKHLIDEKENLGKQYFLSDDNFHPLVNYLLAQSIPRYVILNKSGNIAYFRAPRPSDGDKLISLITKIIEK